MSIMGNVVGASMLTPKSFVLEAEDGTSLVGVTVGEETVFDATPNDVREGKVYAGDDGVKIGEKVIPSYHTREGVKVITAGSRFVITSPDYDYTKLQALICGFNTSLSDSVSTERVAINDNIYDVQSVVSVSIIGKDNTNGTIEFGITNNSDELKIIRYIYYKEID